MPRKYANPPLVEAVCEFSLTSDTPWDLTVPGLFYERVKRTFAHREQRMFQEVELAPGPQGFQQLLRTSERILLFTEDRKMLVQLGPRLLVINALKPYPSWEGFKPRIQEAWEGLQAVLPVRGLERIGLRYIHQIELPDRGRELRKYLNFYPFVGEGLPRTMANFLTSVEFAYEKDACRVQLSPTRAPSEPGPLMLDIYYFLASPGAVDVSHALDWVEEAHTRVEEVFEGCITDSLRELFKEVQ